MDPVISNNSEAERFEAHVDGELAGYAEYRLRDDEIAFTHTEVDSAFGGRGVGSNLIRSSVDQARDRGLRVVPLCPFYKGWFDKHPDEQDLL